MKRWATVQFGGLRQTGRRLRAGAVAPMDIWRYHHRLTLTVARKDTVVVPAPGVVKPGSASTLNHAHQRGDPMLQSP